MLTEENLDEAAGANHEDEEGDDEGCGAGECNSTLGGTQVSGDGDHQSGDLKTKNHPIWLKMTSLQFYE